MVVGGDFVVENVDQIEALLEPAQIVAERKKRLEFLDGETIANRRSWMWADETVRFSVSGPNPGCDRAIERMWSKGRCTRRNPPTNRKVWGGVLMVAVRTLRKTGKAEALAQLVERPGLAANNRRSPPARS